MPDEKSGPFELFIEALSWARIVASPLLMGVAIGFIVMLKWPTQVGFITGISIAVLGLATGIILATRVWKRKGTIEFLSKVSATPELDELKKEKVD